MNASLYLANAGTPLMWAGCFQLIFGNILLGYFESWIIRRRYPSAAASPGWMIAANYLSMFAGIGLVWLAGPLRDAATRDPLRYAIPTIVCLWIVAYVITVFVEWPFVARAAGMRVDRRSLLSSLWVQSVSYALLLPIAMFVGSISAVTTLRAGEVQTVPGWLYYVALDRVSVMRTRLDGSRTETVATLTSPATRTWSRITVEPTSTGDRARLMYREQDKDREIQKNVGLASQAAPVKDRERGTGLALLGNYTFGVGSTRAFRDTPKVYSGFWPLEGLRIDRQRLALETPFLNIVWGSPVVLPDGKVVVQFGDALLLMDPETMKALKLAEGMGGDVLVDLPH